MSIEQVRSTIVDALHDVDATKHVKPALLAAFEEGQQDIRLRDLLLSSLARMELLVALELEHGAVIAPREFTQFKTLGDIVSRVAQSSDDVSATRATEVSPTIDSDPSATTEAGTDEPKPPVVRLFQRAFRSCRVVAHVNKALKILEPRLTPTDFATLCSLHKRGRLIPAQSPAQFGSAISDWMDDLEWKIAGSGKAEPETFTYNRVSPTAVHFVGPGERAKKTLVICFATIGARQMSTPNPVLLQHTDANEYDLLVLSDPWRTGFRRGVPLMGGSVSDVVEWVANLALVSDYGRMRTIGCSAGTYPAMLTARRLNAELGLSVCGRFPDPQARTIGQIIEMYVKSWLSARRNRSARVLMVHGKKSRDKTYARRLARLTGATRLHVKMPGRDVRHNVLRPMVEEGELDYFLQQTLFAPVDSELLANKPAVWKMRVPVDERAGEPKLVVPA